MIIVPVFILLRDASGHILIRYTNICGQIPDHPGKWFDGGIHSVLVLLTFLKLCTCDLIG